MALETILGSAESALGVNYVWGGNSLATGVDCSGLVQQAFRSAGYLLPRVSADQARSGAAVNLNDLQPGDLIWWDNSSRNNGADHIAIYIGNGMMIEAPSRGKQVRVAPVAGRNPTGARRIIGEMTQHSGSATTRVTLGPNQDRRYTQAAVGGEGVPAPTETPTTQDTGVAAGGGGIGDDLPPNATDAQIEAYIRQHYPDVAPFLANEEIRRIAFDAARSDLAPDELAHRFRQTDYYRTHGPDSRRFDALIANDPSEAGRTVDRVKNVVNDIFARNGIEATDEQVGEAAKKAIREGWVNFDGQIANPAKMGDFTAWLLRLGLSPAEQLVDTSTGRAAWTGPNGEAGSASKAEMVAYAEENDLNPASVQQWRMPDGRIVYYIPGEAISEGNQSALASTTGQQGLPAGEASFDADGVQAIARQYLVPISRADAEDWALRMMEGVASEESLRSWLNNLAKARFAAQPDIVAALEAGLTPAQFFAGHRETVARILEMDANQIDLMDPRWMELIEMRDENGNRRAPTLGEVAQWARDRPEFAGTRTYKEQSAGYSVGLSKFLGKAA